MRTPRATLPTGFFKPLAGGILIVELRIGKVDIHGSKPLSMAGMMPEAACFVN
jgi:hypothetical protein